MATSFQTGTALDDRCVNTIRGLAMDAVQQANSGHPGTPMGLADVAYVLWQHTLKHNPTNPHWPDRDRFVLSAGHASMLLYSLLHLTGYDLSLDDVRQFRQWESKTPGHPEYTHTPGVETTTGPLGQGIATAVGMALAERHLAARFNQPDLPLVDHHTYVLASDGDLMEGVSHEAASLAGHLKLGKLIVLYDQNYISIDGSTDLSYTEDVGQRFAAYGWHVQHIDGHDHAAIAQALTVAQAASDQPSIIVTRTHIGFGSPNKQDTSDAHGSPLGSDEIRATKEVLGIPTEPLFHVPAEVAAHMGQARTTGPRQQAAWEDLLARYRAAHPDLAQQWDALWSKRLPDDWDTVLPAFAPNAKGMATRSASEQVINALAPAVLGLLGGSADLHSSNKTLMRDSGPLQADAYANRNMYYGVREHGMGSMMNGIAVHGGLIPYGGTFLVFSDYMRPAIRLAALMGIQVIYVFTHDSIGLGEDGPTHQPVEHLLALRAIPNLHVQRPGDATETASAWRMALERTDGPTALVLSRQNVPILTPRDAQEPYGALGPLEGALQGGYVLADPPGEPAVILLATGSEVGIALDAMRLLAAQEIGARVVSLPCLEVFAQQPQAYRDDVLPPHITARVSLEAATPLGWERFVGPHGVALGVSHYGASAPYQTIYTELGLTAEHMAEVAAGLVAQQD